jgi:type II secretory pathway predicted ATPase ExeA
MASPRVDFYHPAREIDAALHAIERAIRRSEGIGLVVGPPGTGKSLLLAKAADSLREDFDVALLSGARICTRRALWQSILAEIGEPYRNLDEGDLRIGIVERIRGLAATGSGLVVLVDEANTLPTRLIEELRLLTTIPTPLPAVHIVLAGTAELEEMLAAPKMEGVAQRIAVRHYLEPLDHAETGAYLHTQMKAASLDWDAQFDPGCADAVFTASDGVPRLINQLCDHALVAVAEAGRQRVTPADIAAAWREIQRLPPPAMLARADASESRLAAEPAVETVQRFAPEAVVDAGGEPGFGEGVGVIEFGSLDDVGDRLANDQCDDTLLEQDGEPCPLPIAATPAADPFHGPEVELVFDPSADPFAELFQEEERVVERYVMRGPDDFSGHRQVASREGAVMARKLETFAREPAAPAPVEATFPVAAGGNAAVSEQEPDDSDMVVIEEDILEHPSLSRTAVVAVRPGDYRSLFARLRRGDR